MANRVVPDRYGVINIGKLKENLVTEVHLPAPGFAGGSYAVLLRRPKEEQPYPVTVRHEGNNLIWTVQTADTAIAGMGKLECRWYGDNGEVAKSQIYTVRITDGLPDPTEAPEAWAGFMQQVSQDAGRAESAADNAAKTLKKLEDGIASGDFRGEKGEKGEKGDPGPQGPKGEPGPAGDTTAADAAAAAAKKAAQEAQKAAEVSAGSAAQAAESVGGLADDLEAAQKDIAKMKRAIQFQAELNKGQTWDFEEDTQTAYQRIVPSGAKAGAVMAVGGKTVAWNQLLNNQADDVNTITGLDYMSYTDTNGVKTSTIKVPNSSNGFKFLFNAYALISRHAYILFADIKYTTAASKMRIRFQHSGIASTSDTHVQIAKNWQQISSICTMTQGSSVAYLYIDVGTALAVGDTVELKNTRMVDLTLLYGPGNEPADTSDPRIAQIEAYAAAHPEYNAGELMSALVDEVRVRGKNLINPESVERSSNLVLAYKRAGYLLKKGVQYILSTVYSIKPSGIYIVAMDDSTIVKSYSEDSITYTPDKDVLVYFKLYYSAPATLDDSKMMLEIGTKATAYSPYRDPVAYPIPAAVRNLPGYGWSAGSVANTVERTENGWQYIQRVGSVDLGTLDWVAQKSVLYSSQYFTSQSITHPIKAPAFLTAAYATASSSNVVATDKSCWISFNWGEDGRVIIRDDKYADAASFKSAMRGMLLYYELSDYITTDITALMGDSLAPFAVESGGSITMHHPKADEGFAIDVPAKIQYITKLSEVSANG